MARPKAKTKKTAHTLMFAPRVWALFKVLCDEAGVSYNVGAELCIIYALNSGKIPGFTPAPKLLQDDLVADRHPKPAKTPVRPTPDETIPTGIITQD